MMKHGRECPAPSFTMTKLISLTFDYGTRLAVQEITTAFATTTESTSKTAAITTTFGTAVA